jgi:hypothetical protein
MKTKKTKPARKTKAADAPTKKWPIKVHPIAALQPNVEEHVHLSCWSEAGEFVGTVTVSVRTCLWQGKGTEEERNAVHALARDIGTAALAWTLRKEGADE